MSAALHTLLAQAERARDAGLASLAQAEQQARRLQQQAEQLHHYRGELQARHPAGAGQAAPIDQLRTHQGFSGRLDEAITQQQAQRLAALKTVAQRREALVALEMRVAAMRKLLQRRARAVQTVQDQRDQRQTDETAQQQHRRQSPSNTEPL
jgi:flagellar FliJ protein